MQGGFSAWAIPDGLLPDAIETSCATLFRPSARVPGPALSGASIVVAPSMRGNERLWRRLARAPEAVAGVPLAGPRPGSTEPPRAARRALRRHRSRGGGTGAELGHRPGCTLTMRQRRELSPLPLLVQPVGLSARQLDISLRDLLLLLVLKRAASGGERVSAE
eukprot:scaffold38970_cov53-Phaeocystis_antarctica.AAC.1